MLSSYLFPSLSFTYWVQKESILMTPTFFTTYSITAPIINNFLNHSPNPSTPSFTAINKMHFFISSIILPINKLWRKEKSSYNIFISPCLLLTSTLKKLSIIFNKFSIWKTSTKVFGFWHPKLDKTFLKAPFSKSSIVIQKTKLSSLRQALKKYCIFIN